jgi:hypothetical protein
MSRPRIAQVKVKREKNGQISIRATGPIAHEIFEIMRRNLKEKSETKPPKEAAG